MRIREKEFLEYQAEGEQKDVQRKVDAGLHNTDAEAAQSARGSRVFAEGIRSSVAGSQGVSLGGRNVDFSASRGSREKRQRNTQDG